MADDRNWRSYESNDDDRYSNRHNSDRSYRRSRDDRSSRSSPEDDRYEDESRSYRRSRSRSGSPEERRRRRARRREERESRNDSDSNDRRYEDGTYGYNSRRGAYESESRSNKRDEESHYSGNERITGHDWRSKLTSIRDAHFNRSKKAPVMAQNQFKNDGSFLEMFKKQMADKSTTSVTPNSLVLASSSIPYSPDLSLPPLTATPIGLEEPHTSSSTDQDLDGVPMPTHKSLPVPVSVGKRRLAKPLKTGIVLKKPQEPVEDEASQEKLDAWARYLQEVQKYKSANCMDEDNSRPLVK